MTLIRVGYRHSRFSARVYASLKIHAFVERSRPCLENPDAMLRIFPTNEEAFATVASFGITDTTLTSDGELPAAIEEVLLPLADNGGATFTHLLTENSPAIGAGECFAPQPLDQRGMPRTDPCDSGAVETQSAMEPPAPQPEEACFVVPTANLNVVTFCL